MTANDAPVTVEQIVADAMMGAWLRCSSEHPRGFFEAMAKAALAALASAPAGDGAWTPHTGGGCPCDPEISVEVITRAGSTIVMRAGAVIWRYGTMIREIMEPMPADAEVVFWRAALARPRAAVGEREDADLLADANSHYSQTQIEEIESQRNG